MTRPRAGRLVNLFSTSSVANPVSDPIVLGYLSMGEEQPRREAAFLPYSTKAWSYNYFRHTSLADHGGRSV
jgi:hypothetical protein